MLDSQLLEQLTKVVESLYWPTAERFDRSEVAGLDRFMPLADLGLLGMAVPRADGGLGLDPAVTRSVLRSLASGCGATAFMFAQHHGAASSLAASDNTDLRDRWLHLATDRTMVGTTYGHVRRARQPVVAAVPAGPGRWTFSGEAPWATSWDVAAAYSVAAVTPDGDLVWGFFEPGHPGMTAPAPLNLMVFGNTGTVRLRFEDAVVDESNLLAVASLDKWRERDRHLVARPSPLALGVGDRAFALLEEFAPPVADAHREEWTNASEQAIVVSAAVDQHTSVETEVADARADVILTVQKLTTALLSVLGGRAAELSEPAQRLAREALFYIVQGQADNGREALLAKLR